ncbi:MAG: hypothetical protein J6Y45_06585, partial [Bacteroidales bacterium]|nr:hypothetical protein [Bacteroidales bacterium]
MAWVERGVSGAGVGSQGMGSRGVSTPVATGIPASYTGLITGKHEDILGQGLNHINRSTGYEYDSSGRLASALVPDKILSTYYYDARGNLTYSSVQDRQTYATDVTEYTYSGDLIYSATHNDTTCYFSHNSLGGVTYDGLSKRVIQYSYIGFPAKILDENYTVLAEYCYLADGTKLSAERADGTGFVYRGSLKYTLGSGGAITLLGAEIPAGLLTPGGSRYRVTDHLGSVVYELNAAGGTLADGGLYDAWGVRSGIAGSAASPTSLHHFTGQEDQAPGLGVPYTDFGARNYSPALGRWLTPDPLSEKYYGISPY